MVHEVQHRLQVAELDALEVEKGVCMGVLAEDSSEEWRACGEDHLVRLDLLVVAGECHVKEVFVLSEFSEGHTDVAFKVIPPQTKLF